MPRIKFKSTEGAEWQPLPDGDYVVQIDEIEETTSKNDNPQLKVSGHVVGGEHDNKNVTIWYVLMAKSGWKVEDLLEAAGVDYSKEETGETDEKTGKPFYEYDFDTDDLIECCVLYQVSTREYNGKQQNDFSNERAPAGSNEQQAAAPANGAAEQQAAPAQQEQASAAPAAQAGTRRRRVRGG